MDHHAPRSLLKVDATCLKIRPLKYLIIYNFNIPETVVYNQDELIVTLQRIGKLITEDFIHKRVLYQIIASYILKHQVTGETRTWTRSFFVKNNSLAQVSDFLVFDNNTFVRTSLIEIGDIENKLNLDNDTKWRFDRLLSVIFNTQCAVFIGEDVLQRRFLNQARQHKTFSF